MTPDLYERAARNAARLLGTTVEALAADADLAADIERVKASAEEAAAVDLVRASLTLRTLMEQRKGRAKAGYRLWGRMQSIYGRALKNFVK